MAERYETIIAGTRARILQLQVTDDGETIDLSDATVTIKVVERFDTESVLFSTSAAAGSTGLCSYQPTAEDVATAGKYLVQWTIVLEDGRPFVSPPIPWDIGPAL